MNNNNEFAKEILNSNLTDETKNRSSQKNFEK